MHADAGGGDVIAAAAAAGAGAPQHTALHLSTPINAVSMSPGGTFLAAAGKKTKLVSMGDVDNPQMKVVGSLMARSQSIAVGVACGKELKCVRVQQSSHSRCAQILTIFRTCTTTYCRRRRWTWPGIRRVCLP
jgi:hypothetical protein